MADTPSSILLLRLQSTGSNTNLWGGYINVALQTLERASKGYESLAVTGDATISWTNYSASNSGAVARLKLTGSPTGACTLTFPAYQNFVSVENSTSQTVTIKCSGGTGVSIPPGQKMLLYCDAVDYYNAAATIGPTQSQSTNTYAFVQWGAFQTALATASLPATSGTLLVSALDTTAGYLGQKLAEGTGIDLTDSGAGNSTLTVAVDTTELEEFLALTGKITATLSSGTTAMTARRRYRISSTATGTLPTMGAGDFVIVEFTNGAGVTATVACNSQTIDGTAEDDTYIGGGTETPVIRYDYASAGAVTSRLIEVIP